jgi:hypothetical protein
MNHSFNVEIAKRFGVNSAIILNHLFFWIEKNKANNTHYYDGNYWTRNTEKAFTEIFPYLTKKQIRYALEKLIKEGVVVTGNYNQKKYDRTLWYAIKPNVFNILQNCQMQVTKLSNASDKIVTPIPDITTDINKKDISKDISKKAIFIKPTFEEISQYCRERKNKIDPQHFIDYYEANGWMVGRNKMKDWKACVRTWEARQKKDKPYKQEVKEKVPEWFDKEIEQKEATIEEQEAMKEMLKEFKEE